MSRSRSTSLTVIGGIGIVVGLIIAIYVSVSPPDVAWNSAFHERTWRRLVEVSTALFELNDRHNFAGCVPVLDDRAESAPRAGWHSKFSPISEERLRHVDRVWDKDRRQWFEVTLYPVAIGESLESGCLKVDPGADHGIPIMAMVPIYGDRLDRPYLGSNPMFGANLRQDVHEQIWRDVTHARLEHVWLLLSNGEVTAVTSCYFHPNSGGVWRPIEP